MGSDKLLIEDVRFYAHHGVTPAEQTVGAWFAVDVELAVDLAPAAASDDLRTTVDYGLVTARIVEVGTVRAGEPARAAGGAAGADAARRVPLSRGACAGPEADAAHGWPPGDPRRRADTPPLSGKGSLVSRVFLSVGSNLGDRLECLRRAMDELRAMPDVLFLDASALYQTEPWEQRPGQPAGPDTWFFNCVVELETSLDPGVLLERLQDVERALGRLRKPGTPEEGRFEPPRARHRHPPLREIA